MHALDISISYDRVLQDDDEIAAAVCENMKMKGIVAYALFNSTKVSSLWWP